MYFSNRSRGSGTTTEKPSPHSVKPKLAFDRSTWFQSSQNQSKYKIEYWDARDAVEPIRLLLVYAGVEWEDCRLTCQPSGEDVVGVWLKHTVVDLDSLLPSLPALHDTVSGIRVTQERDILRYLALKYNLAGGTIEEMAMADMVVDSVLDFWNMMFDVTYCECIAAIARGTWRNGLDTSANGSAGDAADARTTFEGLAIEYVSSTLPHNLAALQAILLDSSWTRQESMNPGSTSRSTVGTNSSFPLSSVRRREGSISSIVLNVTENLKLLPNRTSQRTTRTSLNLEQPERWMAGWAVTYADLVVFEWLDQNVTLAPNCLDSFPTLRRFYERVAALPPIRAYRSGSVFKWEPLHNEHSLFHTGWERVEFPSPRPLPALARGANGSSEPGADV